MAKGIRALLDTVMQALPQVGNLGLLFFLLFFIFAALGVELFGRLECDDSHPCQGLGEHAHFKNFGMAFLTLFRVATGDNWNGIMKDTLRDNCDDEPDCVKNCCLYPFVAPIFFVVFVLMAQFVLVNVVVAVLMKHLEESHKLPPEARGDGDSSEDSLDESTDEDGLDIPDEGLYEFVEDSSDDGSEVWAHDEHEIIRKHNAMSGKENDSMEEVRQIDSQLNETRHLEKGIDKTMDGQEWVIDLVADKSFVNENDHICTSEDAAVLPERGKNVVNQGSMFTPRPEGIFKDTHDVKSGRGESTTCKIEFSNSVIRIVYDEQQPADRSRELNEMSRNSVTDEERMCHTQDDRNEGGGKSKEHSISLENDLSKKDNVTLDVRLRLVSLIESCRFKFKKEKCKNTPPSNHKSRRSRKRKDIKAKSSNDNTQKTRQNLDQSPGDKTLVKKDVKIKFMESLLEQNPILEYNCKIIEPPEKHYSQKECLRSMKMLEDKACNTETEFLCTTYNRNITVSENTQDTIEFIEAKDDDLSIQEGSVFRKSPNISAFENDTKRNCENELEQEARRGFCSNNAKGDNSIHMSDSQKPLKETGARRKHL